GGQGGGSQGPGGQGRPQPPPALGAGLQSATPVAGARRRGRAGGGSHPLAALSRPHRTVVPDHDRAAPSAGSGAGSRRRPGIARAASAPTPTIAAPTQTARRSPATKS